MSAREAAPPPLLAPLEPVTLGNCDREPIHVPGAIQPHGVLVACREDDELTVEHVSSNAADVFGLAPDAIVDRSAANLFDAAGVGLLRSLADEKALREKNPAPLTSRTGAALEAVLHRSGGLLVIELEQSRGTPRGFEPALRHAIVRLQAATDVGSLTRYAAEEVRRLTGFDRVMVYRFDADWNGEVVAEARRDDLEPFLGLHYPASDIPAQARRLYTQNWIRLIPDVAYTPSRLVPDQTAAVRAPLDLAHAHLRSVSPIHIEYLKNMGVTASMSISLVSDGVLRGLIACHHYSGPHRVRFSVRETAEYLGQALSWNLRVLEHADESARALRVQRCEAELATNLAAADDVLAGLAVPALAELTGAAGAAVVLEEGVRTVGKTPDDRRIGEIVAWLRSTGHDTFATDHFAAEYAPAERWDGVVAGLLATTLSNELGEYLLWFRPSAERTVDWAGDPRKQVVQTSAAAPRLSPRGSFALWRETVRGRSLPWQPWQIEAASNVRRLLIGGVRRRAAAIRALNDRLSDADRAKDVFIATTSHELRTPLNAISGWTRLITSGSLGRERWAEAIQVVAQRRGPQSIGRRLARRVASRRRQARAGGRERRLGVGRR